MICNGRVTRFPLGFRRSAGLKRRTDETMERRSPPSAEADLRLASLLERPRVARAVEHVRAGDAATIDAQVELSEIAAPPFSEGPRARRMAALLEEAGLSGVHVDDAGNVLGTLPNGASARRSGGRTGPLVVSAHLDTVFPSGTDVRVERNGDLLRGPGISDDARGLATVLAVARALRAAHIETETPVLFAATVGEEGIGDLRGVRHLFADGGPAAGASGFISLDGAGIERVIVRGLGSRRFRIRARGAGGHSWMDWGTPNPIHALARVAGALASLDLSTDPLTTLTIARWGGGTSINAIPQEAWLELDTRSEDETRLALLEAEVRDIVGAAAASAGRGLVFEIEPVGSRPGGHTPVDSLLVQATLAATRSLGSLPELAVSSTDANIPMARGVPALTIGCGGEAGKAHTTHEWYRNVRGVEGVLRALYTVLAVAGVEG